MSVRDYCADCGIDFDSRSVGDVLFHGLGHNEAYRVAAAGLYFIGDSTRAVTRSRPVVSIVAGIRLAGGETDGKS